MFSQAIGIHMAVLARTVLLIVAPEPAAFEPIEGEVIDFATLTTIETAQTCTERSYNAESFYSSFDIEDFYGAKDFYNGKCCDSPVIQYTAENYYDTEDCYNPEGHYDGERSNNSRRCYNANLVSTE
ncbi:hypothetical protein GGI17_006357, partial [Coemansia sp. S146]